MSIKKEVSEGKVDIKPLASYAIFVEKGTAPHIIRPVNARCSRISRWNVGWHGIHEACASSGYEA